MRAHQFILVEYRRDKTGVAIGDKLIDALAAAPLYSLPDSLYGASTLVKMAKKPDDFRPGNVSMDILGKNITVSPETAEQVAIQIKPQIIETILAEIEAIDPTKNKEYVQWLARAWVNSGGREKFEDLNRGDLLNVYTIAKRRQGLIPAEARDINKFKTYRDFERWMVDNNVSEKISDQDLERTVDKGASETVYDDSEARVIVPGDEAAACYYGRGTVWCTAATKGNNMFNHYNRQGKMYIILPKSPKYEGEKYQLHFPSSQFMNEQDEPVSLSYILKSRFPELLSFFKEQEPVIENFVEFASDELLEGLGKILGEIISDQAWETLSDWESNDDYFREWQSEQAIERGYVDENGDVDWDSVYEDDDLNDYTEFNDDAHRFIKDIKSISNLNGKQIKSYASDSDDGEEEGTPTVNDLEGLYSWIIDNEVGENGHSISEFLRRRVTVLPSEKFSEKYGSKQGEFGGWTVSTSRSR